MEVIDYNKPGATLHIGDFGNWESLSRHPRMRGVKRSYPRDKEAVRARVKDLQKAQGPKGRLIFVKGNHDAWLDRYIAEHAPELEDDDDFDSRSVFGLQPRDEVVEYREGIHIGKVYYTHEIGHTGPGSTRQNLVAAGQCIVTGHSHLAGVEYGGTVLGEHNFSMQLGWMGDPNKFKKKPYMPVAKMRNWQRGLGVVDYDEKWNLGFAHFCPYVKGRLVVNGKVFK